MSHRTHLTVDLALRALLKRSGHIGLGLGAFTPVLALANPTGGQVMAGQASITSPAANGLVIHQSSQSAIINWQQFNIGSGEYVQFMQPSTSSVVLNRVVGGSPTSIFGSLTANGQVFLVNTNGVFFGHGASLDAQGFLASSLDIKDSDFLARHYLFTDGGNGTAKVVNQGNISAHRGGYVVLAGDYSENDGIIAAQSGHVILASGAKSTLTLNGNSLVSYVVNGATLSSLAGVDNAGKLSADGGTVIMTADVANALKATVVNNTGLIEARSLSKYNGGIFLTAEGGNIVNAGSLDADAMAAGHAGGNITLKGDGLTNLTNTSKISALGIGADGGHVEVSGNTVALRGGMKMGKGGNLLIDPNSVEIVQGNSASGAANGSVSGTGAAIGVSFIEGRLNSGADVTILAHDHISKANSVTAITGTNPAGDLTLRVATGGQINLSGVDINIAGKLTANMGFGTFGHLTAGSIDLTASSSVRLAGAVKNSKGVVTTYSVKATTGNLTIGGGATIVGGSSSDGLALDAAQSLQATDTIQTQGSVVVVAAKGSALLGSISAGGTVKINASAIPASSGRVTLKKVTAGKGISVTAVDARIQASSLTAISGDITLSDDSDNINISKKMSAASGNVTVSITNGDLNIGANGSISAGKDLTIDTSVHQTAFSTVPLTLKAGGNLTVQQGFAMSSFISTHSGASTTQIAHSLDLQAGGTITLGAAFVKVPGNLTITGKKLVYTGNTGTFTASAMFGSLVFDASIGSAKAAAKYAVALGAQDGALHVQRSIFSAKGVQISQTGVGTSGGTGVYVGANDGTAVTLSAKGPISITGALVGVGFTGKSGASLVSADAAVLISADDGNVLTNTDILSLTATGSGLGMGVFVHGENGSDFNGSAAKVSKDRSVTLHAGADVVLTGKKVHLTVGNEQASVGSSGAVLNVKNSITVTAGRDILINATSAARLSGGSEIGDALGGSKTESVTLTGGVSLTAGRDINFEAKSVHLNAGSASADARAAATVVAIADVSLTAGRDVILHASSNSFVGVSAGYAQVTAITGAAKQKASATASAGVTIKAGHDLTLSGNGVNILGGKDAASGAQVSAGQSGAKATAIAHADVALSAVDAISATVQTIQVGAGNGAAIAHSSFVGSSHNHTVTWDPTRVSATGQKAAASLTATANVSLKAGAGGITLIGSGGLFASAGKQAALAVQVDAGSLGGKASVDAEAKLSLVATGDVSLTDTNNLQVRGGASAAGIAQSFSSTHHGTSVSRTITGSQATRLHAGPGGIASLKTDVSVTITAGGALALADTNLAGTNHLIVSAGARAAGSVEVSATGAKAAANAAIDTAVSLTAGKGGLTLETHTNSGGTLQILAAAGSSHAQIASHASVSADFGAKAGLAIDSRIVMSTKGDLVLAARREVVVEGGSNGFRSAGVHASSGAATASLQDGVSLTVGGVFGVNAASTVGFIGAQHQAQSDSVSAVGAGAKAGLSADGRISVNAGGGFNLGAKFFAVSAGRHMGSGVDITGSAGGSATLTTQAGISFVGGGNFTLNVGGAGGDLRIIGGFGGHDDVTAKHGKAALNQDGSVLISATGNLDVLAPAVTIGAGSGAVGASDHVNVNRGSATVTGLDGIALKAGKEFVASGAGSGTGSGLSIAAGHSVGANAVLSARGPGSKLVMQTTVGISIAAGSDGSLKGKHLFALFAGNNVAHSASIHASSGAVLNDSASAGLNITAGGAFLATAQAAQLIMVTGFAAGKDDSISVNQGTVSFKADAGLHVTAKTSLTLTGGSGGTVETRLKTGSDESLHAVAGTINASVLSDLSLTAGGALHTSMTLGLSIGAGEASSVGNAVAANDDLSAHGVGAKISLLANGGVTLKGGDITLGAGATLQLGANGSVAHGGNIAAASGAVVSETGLAGLSIKASGAFEASAASLTIEGGVQTGQSLDVGANGPGAKATAVADASVSISAKTVTITDTGGFNVTGGGGAGGGMQGSANSGGAATMTLASQVSIKATGILTVSAGGGNIQAGGGLHSAELDADHGKLTLTDTSNIALTAGGNLTLDMGGGSLQLSAGAAGSAQQISAGQAGTVSEKADASLLLKSGATLTLSNINSLNVNAAVIGSGSEPAVTTSGTGKVSGLVDGSVSILGKSVVTSSVTNFTQNSLASFTDAGLVFKTGITVSGGVSVLDLPFLAPLGLRTLQQDALIMSLEPVLSAPSIQAAPVQFVPQAGMTIGSAACQASLVGDSGRCQVRK